MVRAANSTDLAIEATSIEKVYRKGQIHALRDVNLRVPRGSVFGLLGPNGAGKSTLVKTLLSIVRPTSGEARLLGRSFRDTEARREVGYLPEGHRFPRYLTGEGVCRYFGKLAGLQGSELDREVESKLSLTGMLEWRGTKVSRYSKGMAQRVGLAQAMLGNPQLILLDEPTDGVDPIGRKEIREVIRRISSEFGCTVFVNSHLLQEIELMCDQVAIMHKGAIIKQGSVDEIRHGLAGESGIRVRVQIGQVSDEAWGKLHEEGARTIGQGVFEYPLPSKADITPLIDRLRAARVDIYGIETIEASLEEIFMQVIGSQSTGGVGGGRKA